MAIYRLLKHCAFNRKEAEIIAAAYEDVLSALDLPNDDNPVTEVVARKILDIAAVSKLDRVRISTRAIAELGIPRAA